MKARIAMLLLAGMTLTAWADGKNDALHAHKVTVTLVQAITAAEHNTGGRAVRAKLENEHGALAYEVEVVSPKNEVFDVKVDAQSAQVLSGKLDKNDHEEDEEDDDDKR